MIVDTLENLKNYVSVNPLFADVIDFLSKNDLNSLEAGKQADFLLLDGESPAALAYHAGANPVAEVYKKGVCVA